MSKEGSIDTVAVLGAGAVGSYIISSLADKLGDKLWVIADGARKERLLREGLRINERVYRPQVKTPAEAHGVDLLFVALKYQALLPSLPDIRQAVGKDTIVVSLMNGIDSEEIIGECVGKEHILYSLIRITSRRTESGVSFELPEGYNGIYLGMPGKKAAEEPRIAAIAALFSGTPLLLHPSDDILYDMWDKFAVNISRNLPQAVASVGAGAYDDSPYLRDVEEKLRAEVCAVARAKGVHIPEKNKAGAYEKSSRYSTLQDLDAGRHTEIDMFCGTLSRLGRELGVPTPYSECIYDFIKVLEEKNDGKFDY